MDLVKIKIGEAAAVGLLGYLVVFIGLILLMLVVMLLGRIMVRNAQKAVPAKAAAAEEVPAAAIPEQPKAPGTAGELKLYDTDPRDAAMIMAIVADTLGKPLNELRFKSIREVSKK